MHLSPTSKLGYLSFKKPLLCEDLTNPTSNRILDIDISIYVVYDKF